MAPGDFSKSYWNQLFGWYDEGGDRHVAAYLRALDLTGFDPKAPPPKTQAFWDIVDANQAPEEMYWMRLAIQTPRLFFM
jgi:hypothetical protein